MKYAIMLSFINAVTIAHFVLPQTTIKYKFGVFTPLRGVKRPDGYEAGTEELKYVNFERNVVDLWQKHYFCHCSIVFCPCWDTKKINL